MSNSGLLGFYRQFPDSEKYAAFPDASVQALQDMMPESLLQLYKEEGLHKFEDGFYTMLDPFEYRVLNQLWVCGLDSENLFFLRTAFGDCLVASGRGPGAKFISRGINNPDELDISDDFKWLNMALTGSSAESDLYKRLYAKAIAKLGPLAPDECYGFNYPLFAGGAANIQNVRKFNFLEYTERCIRLSGMQEIPGELLPEKDKLELPDHLPQTIDELRAFVELLGLPDDVEMLPGAGPAEVNKAWPQDVREIYLGYNGAKMGLGTNEFAPINQMDKVARSIDIATDALLRDDDDDDEGDEDDGDDEASEERQRSKEAVIRHFHDRSIPVGTGNDDVYFMDPDVKSLTGRCPVFQLDVEDPMPFVCANSLAEYVARMLADNYGFYVGEDEGLQALVENTRAGLAK